MDKFLSLAFVGTFLLVTNAILYLLRLKGNSKAYSYFSTYLILIAIIEVSTILVAKAFHQNNLFLSHFYFIIQFVLLSMFYSELLKSRWIRWIVLPVVGMIAYQFIAEPSLFFRYNPIGASIMQSLIVIYSLIYFYRSLDGNREFLIVNIGIFLYLLSSALIFVSGNLVLDLNLSENTRYLLINVNRVLILVFQILIFVEWRKNYSVRKAR